MWPNFGYVFLRQYGYNHRIYLIPPIDLKFYELYLVVSVIRVGPIHI